MKILKIKKLKNNKYKLELENNSITLFEDVIIDNNLLYKNDIDDELLQKLENENIYYELYNKVLKYIMTKMRSIYEVEQYLDKLDAEKCDKERIIDKLKDINLLNDKLYADAYVSDKINLSNDGPYKIKKELKDKKIDENIIEEYISKYEDFIFVEKIKKIISKKKNSKYSNYIYKQKLLNYFINLGYDKNMVIPILEDIDSDVTDILKKEYISIYNKLSKKYEEPKLSYEIKNRLYKKGFSIDDINKIKE